MPALIFRIVYFLFIKRGSRISSIVVVAIEVNDIGVVCVAIDVGEIIGQVCIGIEVGTIIEGSANCLPLIYLAISIFLMI